MLLIHYKTRIKDLKNDKISEVPKITLTKIKLEPLEVENKSNELCLKCQITEIKDLFHCQKDNIIYFVNNNDKPYDDGAIKLTENDKLESKPIINYPDVTYSKRHNDYYYFSLCLREEDKLSI